MKLRDETGWWIVRGTIIHDWVLNCITAWTFAPQSQSMGAERFRANTCLNCLPLASCERRVCPISLFESVWFVVSFRRVDTTGRSLRPGIPKWRNDTFVRRYLWTVALRKSEQIRGFVRNSFRWLTNRHLRGGFCDIYWNVNSSERNAPFFKLDLVLSRITQLHDLSVLE